MHEYCELFKEIYTHTHARAHTHTVACILILVHTLLHVCTYWVHDCDELFKEIVVEPEVIEP